VLDAVYSPHWLTADSSLLAGEHLGFADVNDNEVTSTGEPVTVLQLNAHHLIINIIIIIINLWSTH